MHTDLMSANGALLQIYLHSVIFALRVNIIICIFAHNMIHTNMYYYYYYYYYFSAQGISITEGEETRN